MNMVLDERLKHRLVGLAVVLSLGAIFAPAILKKSNRRFDDNRNITIQLPAKPLAPKVTAKNEQILFKRMTVAHVDLPKIKDDAKPLTTLARAEPLSPANDAQAVETAIAISKDLASNDTRETVAVVPAKKVQVASVANTKAPTSAVKKAAPAPVKTPPDKTVPKTTNRIKPTAVNKAKPKNAYTVQLGLFSQQKNALALVNKLKSKGYQSYLIRSNGKNGLRYKVLVGQTAQRYEAKRLQQRLASSERVNGFVVSTNGLG